MVRKVFWGGVEKTDYSRRQILGVSTSLSLPSGLYFIGM